MGAKGKAVVTGGSGFLGSHIADVLQDNGYEVHVFDLVESRWLRDGQTMWTGNLLDSDRIAEVVEGATCVYHLGGIADIGQAASDPVTTVQCNVLGTTNVLQACVDAGVKRIMFGSSAYVYSDQGSFYRVTKQACEALVEAYYEKYGLEYTILRYGSLYGPRAQEWNGLKSIIRQAVESGSVVYKGTGRERREYIHVVDAAKLSVRALEDSFANACLMLTGTQVLYSTELLETINEVMGSTLEITIDDTNVNKHHYKQTPYRYTPKQGHKIIPEVFVDIGQGILDVVEEVHQEMSGENGDG